MVRNAQPSGISIPQTERKTTIRTTASINSSGGTSRDMSDSATRSKAASVNGPPAM
jgi:hypothetical protein